ncbi:riboflavin synthase domain-like protein [Glonium stellatum]|uniref:NADPH-dependent diflavin oxidoreductase 1 n=1 Tax=Glonium stellatum TaxID=574774 RepID=A0A8E2F703_9PEZI|nr:riboflavin synthase domain-like protein [Glonium stellatum]
MERPPPLLESTTRDIIPSYADRASGDGVPPSVGATSGVIATLKREATVEVTQSPAEGVVQGHLPSTDVVQSIPSSLASISQSAGDALAGRTALVLYGSETGNAQDIAEELSRIAERLRFNTQVSDLNSITVRQLLQPSVVLIAISTTGQGDLPANSQAFWKTLRSVRLRLGCLRSVRFASFGLGDTSYPKFNWAHRKLYNRLVQLGAQPVCDRGEADDQHPEGVDGSFLPWSIKLRQRLLEEYPLPNGVDTISDDVLLEPKWILDFATSEAISTSMKNSQSGIASSEGSERPATYSNHQLDQSVPLEKPPEDLLPISGSLTATIISNTRLTPPTYWQDVRHLTLTTNSQSPYYPGDTLTIYPKNFPSDVTQFLDTMKWLPIADKPLKFMPTSPATLSSRTSPPLSNLSAQYDLTLRKLLTNHLDIMSIPRRSFFAKLAHFTNDAFHRERLLEFTNPEYIDELYDYTTRPRRSILEVLQEFESVRIPWQHVCSVIPSMRGRQFSIASGGRLKTVEHELTKQPALRNGQGAASIQDLNGEDIRPQKDHARFELLIAIVKYRTVIKRIREGICTRYIASLKPSQQLSVTLQRGGLGISKTESAKPVVMVGPGTGVAPMRALIYERLSWRRETVQEPTGGQNRDDAQEKESGEEIGPTDTLFFGCRNSQADFFFKEEWEALKEEKVALDVFPAFSRDQRNKVYVQDLIRNHAPRVYEALAIRNGLIYICGSSGKMPQAVRESLVEVFQQQGNTSRGDAEAYLISMEKAGRYKQETW